MREQFPFDFALEVDFAIENLELRVTGTVINRSPWPMPVSFGFHPAFRWPLPYGCRREHHVVDSSVPKRLRCAAGLMAAFWPEFKAGTFQHASQDKRFCSLGFGRNRARVFCASSPGRDTDIPVSLKTNPAPFAGSQYKPQISLWKSALSRLNVIAHALR